MIVIKFLILGIQIAHVMRLLVVTQHDETLCCAETTNLVK
jgi:hypothetical protein